MKRSIAYVAAAALAVAAGQASAQNSGSSTSQTIDAIFGALFGRPGTSTSIDAEWAAGRTPLLNQRAQFDSRVDSEVSTGALTRATGARLKSDYAALVELETRYGADRRFSATERNDLVTRYNTLTQVFTNRGYADGATAAAEIAEGRAEFDTRVNAAVTQRRISRTQGTRLRSDYAALIQVESGYLADGVISDAERADLDARLDDFDARLGDTQYAATPPTPRARINAIGQALPTARLDSVTRSQLQVEYEDISRLEAAYSRLGMSADEQAYLEHRLGDLETRAGVRAAARGY